MVAANFLGSRLTLLYGPSGVGKTSLLRAGVAAELATRWRRRGARRQPAGRHPLRHHSWADPPLAGLMAAIAEQLGEEGRRAGAPRDASRPAVRHLREWTGDGRRISSWCSTSSRSTWRYHPTDDGEGNLAAELAAHRGRPGPAGERPDRDPRGRARSAGPFQGQDPECSTTAYGSTTSTARPRPGGDRQAARHLRGAGHGREHVSTGIGDEDALLRDVLEDDEL